MQVGLAKRCRVSRVPDPSRCCVLMRTGMSQPSLVWKVFLIASLENGIIVLDDYYTWDGCSRALHDFLSRRSSTERIRNLGDVCFLRKEANAKPVTEAALP
jgi:hypothetical protein